MISENLDSIASSLGHSTSVLSNASATNLLHTYQQILSELLRASTETPTRIQELDFLSQRDRQQILHWNKAHPVSIDACIHHVFQERVRLSPCSPAICSWDGDLTYEELDILSSNLARYLYELGVGPEIIVAVSFEKSIWAIVAELAVLKAGGAFVPIDDSHPTNRLKAIFQIAGVRLLLTSRSRVPKFGCLGPKVIEISPALFDTLPDFRESHDLGTDATSNNAAFVLFTSGSTGTPKAVVQSHGTIVTLFDSHAKALHVDETSRVFQFAAYTFDVSTMDIYTALMQGACICIPSEEDRRNNIAGAMNRMMVNWADLTPTIAKLIRPEEVPSLNTLVLAGEAAQQEHVHRWVGRARLINCYGPVESGNCTAYEYPSTSSPANIIGPAMSAALCWIVHREDHNKLASVGQVGEILVEGPTLARGYLKEPDKTAAVFIRRPHWVGEYTLATGSRCYKTGDLAYYNSDGLICFVGRADLQIKIHGQRVEMSEAEYHLSTCPAVAKSMVLFPKSGRFSKRLVAVVQLKDIVSQFPSSDDIRLTPKDVLETCVFTKEQATSFLREQIPAYMIPTLWFVIYQIPLSTSGKIDRNALDQWILAVPFEAEWGTVKRSLTDLHYIPQNNHVALELSDFVSDMISRDFIEPKVRIQGKNFVLNDAGLDSIQTITLLSWIRKRYRVRIAVETLTHPQTTIMSLAKEVQGASNTGSELQVKSTTDLPHEVTILSRTFMRTNIHLYKERRSQRKTTEVVFLTGSTGYLGKQILKQLLMDTKIKNVIVHIRANDSTQGLERIKRSAMQAGWWLDSFVSRVEVWPGDLAKPKLGLPQCFWKRLTGDGPPDTCVDAIIHNGAVVRYNIGYEPLKATNVLSTLELLNAMAASDRGMRFVLVSGGQRLSVGPDDDQANLAKVSSSTGYAQSKLVSELLVKRFGSSTNSNGHQIIIIKPGYIIGTPEEGVANLTDYIWRLVAAAIDAKVCSHDAGWLFISDVARVTDEMLNHVFAEHDEPCKTVKITDGIDIRDFWSILRDGFGYVLNPLGSSEWWKMLRREVEEAGEKHCLWPLLHMLDKKGAEMVSPVAPSNVSGSRELARVKAALTKNIEFLIKEGFLPLRNPVSQRI